jgi:hypothetical protein
VGAILLSLAGNGADHLVAAHLVPVTWPLVLAVGSTPALVLGITSHLAALRLAATPEPAPSLGEPAPAGPIPESGTPPKNTGLPPGSPAHETTGPDRVLEPVRQKPVSDEEALAAAREADAAYRAARGRGITRDALRAELRISGARASQLLRELRAEQEAIESSKQTDRETL